MDKLTLTTLDKHITLTSAEAVRTICKPEAEAAKTVGSRINDVFVDVDCAHGRIETRRCA